MPFYVAGRPHTHSSHFRLLLDLNPIFYVAFAALDLAPDHPPLLLVDISQLAYTYSGTCFIYSTLFVTLVPSFY